MRCFGTLRMLREQLMCDAAAVSLHPPPLCITTTTTTASRCFSITSKALPHKQRTPSIAQQRLRRRKYQAAVVSSSPPHRHTPPRFAAPSTCSNVQQHQLQLHDSQTLDERTYVEDAAADDDDDEVYGVMEENEGCAAGGRQPLPPVGSRPAVSHVPVPVLTPPTVQGEWRPFDGVRWPLLSSASVCPRSLSLVVLGTPNAGKSQLMNVLLHNHLTAVSPKRNTTRHTMKGIYTINDLQLVVYDTPGMNSQLHAKHYQRQLATDAWSALPHADMVILLIDAAKSLGAAENELLRKAREYCESSPATKLVLCLNKVDLVNPKDKLLNLALHLTELIPTYSELFMVSALTKDGISDVESYLYDQSIEREWLYEQQQTSDSSKMEVMHEIIREKIYQRLNQELPYSIQQSTTSIHLLQNDAMQIHHNIIVQQPAHVPMVIGSGGSVVRWIIEQATPALEQLYGCRIYLSLRVMHAAKADKPDIQSEVQLHITELMQT